MNQQQSVLSTSKRPSGINEVFQGCFWIYRLCASYFFEKTGDIIDIAGFAIGLQEKDFSYSRRAPLALLLKQVWSYQKGDV